MRHILPGRFCRAVDLSVWEQRAVPGETLSYFTGRSLGNREAMARKSEADIINRIRSLYNLGRIELTQRRLSWGGIDSEFEYIATWRNTPAKINVHGELRLIEAAVA